MKRNITQGLLPVQAILWLLLVRDQCAADDPKILVEQTLARLKTQMSQYSVQQSKAVDNWLKTRVERGRLTPVGITAFYVFLEEQRAAAVRMQHKQLDGLHSVAEAQCRRRIGLVTTSSSGASASHQQ